MTTDSDYGYTKPILSLRCLSTPTATVALKHLQIARNQWADWEAQRDYAKSQGLRPMYCPHGRYQHTDADIVCGACEDEGQEWDYLAQLGYAVAEAKVLEARVMKRQMIFHEAVQAGTDSLPVGELMEWVHSGWSGWLTFKVRGYGK